MNFILLGLCIYLYIKYKDVAKDCENLSNHIEKLEDYISDEI